MYNDKRMTGVLMVPTTICFPQLDVRCQWVKLSHVTYAYLLTYFLHGAESFRS